MAEKIPQTLTGVSETLLMTLHVRAREAQRPGGAFHDEKAVEMVNRLDVDFSRLTMQRHDEIAVIVRMQKFDDHVRGFLRCCPSGVVVHIGCGLDTRFERVAERNGRQEWFDLDLPEVIELRDRLVGKRSERCHTLAASVFEEGWLAEVERFKPGPFLFIAEGVLPYFEEEQVKSLFLRLRDHFPGCEVVCDAHTPFVIWADNLHLVFAGIKARMHWKLKDPRDVEAWGADICLLDEWNYYVEGVPLMKPYRWLRRIPGVARSSGILHYRLGK